MCRHNGLSNHRIPLMIKKEGDTMEIRKNLSAIIRIRMKESGKSLTEFSEELEISRSTLQDYLAGKGNPNVATIEHLAKKLNMDASPNWPIPRPSYSSPKV